MVCSYAWDFTGGPLRGKDSDHGDGRIDCGCGPVDGSDWTRVRGAVDFSPGGVRIGYNRGALCD